MVEVNAAQKARMVSKIRDALDQDSFALRFQPITCIATGKTTHHEILLRMTSKDGQLIGPDAFLPAAVRFGLMAEIPFFTTTFFLFLPIIYTLPGVCRIL